MIYDLPPLLADFFIGTRGDWETESEQKGRERELAATEEREHKERWEGEQERFLSSPWFPASLTLTG